MAEGFIQLPEDGVGKKTRTLEVSKDGEDVHQQVTVLANPDGTLARLGDAYRFNDSDDTDGTYDYFGFSAEDGSWLIKRMTKSASELRYATGTTGYAAAWTGRASQSYGY
jgi:hypothetical protein